MQWVYDDGGRSKYFKGDAGDCVTRAVAIATGRDYKEVYDELTAANKEHYDKKRKQSKKKCHSARNGIAKDVCREYIEGLGWKWTPTMQIGSGCQVHMKADELPSGTVICSVSKHLVCVKDGVIHDTYDCSRDETRCVYGYWTPPPVNVDYESLYKDLQRAEADIFDARNRYEHGSEERREIETLRRKIESLLVDVNRKKNLTSIK